MAAEIRVPVKLEVLQNSIAQIKSTLSSLKPESGAWKELQNILRSMTREADSLQSAMSKPFSGQHQFTAAEKGVEKIEDALERARIAMGRIKFSDIQLDAGQLASVKEFEKQLQDIQNKAKNFKATLKAELQGSEQWADFLKIDPNAAIHSYDEIVKAVTARVKQIEDESKRAAEALRIATDESTRAEATNKFFTAKKALSKESMGTDWDQFFSIDKNGATRFKSGQKNAFYDWMRDNLTITPEQYEEIKSKTITELQKWIQDFDISAIIKDAENKRTAKSDASAQVAQLVADSKKIESLQATLTANQTRLAPNNQELAAETAKVTAEYNAFKTSAENSARAALSTGTAMQQVSAECQTLYNALQRANSAWVQADRAANTLNGMRQAVVNFMGFNQVLNITRRAVREAANHIKELDTVMSRIAIVTDMSTGDLWNQIDTYSNMAQSYGVSIKGAYEVSQIYYQQGLETADVMTLTNETLKLAKISGLDYATTTDYMTTAIRGFKMEMQDAATVVDVYSALAANTAVSQEELAVAMSKTASSMQGVGATFEEASAMIGTMVAVTRESATNIGSAMKSIASRYGELTKDPMTLVDSEGEVLAFNKVDTALQSVGISMRTADGQFRNFTDVILELSDAWDSLDSTQQRYIATQFAGNRQQSRFLALVSNGEMLRQNIEVAESSEDTGTVQALKALDSIESKTEQVKVAYQQFYTTIGAENIWKAGLDGLTNYINMLNTLPKVFGKIPVGALAMIANLVEIIRGLGDSIVEHIASIWQRILPMDGFTKQSNKMQQDATEAGSNVATGYTQGMQQGTGQAQSAGEKLGQSGIEGLKNGAGTHSPSVPATEAGTNVGTGYAQGMESAINLVYEAGQKLGAAGIQGLQDKLQELSSGSLTDQIAGLSKFLNTDGTALSPESKSFLQEQLAIAQSKLDQSEVQTGKVETPDQSISSDAVEASTSKIQDQINALQELKALRQEINGLEKGSVEYQEKQELFTKKSVDFNKQLADENVKQVSWNAGANKIQERIDILQKPLKATAGPAAAIAEQARNNAVVAQQRSENANTNVQNGVAEAAKQEAQEAAKQAEESAERAETALEQIATLTGQGQGNNGTLLGDSVSSVNNPLSPVVSAMPPNNPPDDYNDYMERQYEDYVTQFSLPEDAFIPQINSDTAQDFSLVGVEVQKLHKDISDTIDELINFGKIGQEAGEKLKSGLTDNWDPEKLQNQFKDLNGQLNAARAEKYQNWGRVDAADEEAQAMAAKEAAAEEEKHGAAIQKVVGYMREKTDEGDAFGRKLSMIGSAIATVTSLIDKSTDGGRAFAGAMTMASGAVKVISSLMQKNPWMALATGIVTIVNGISMMIEDDTERAERLTKEAEEASNKAKIAKADQRSVEKAIKEYDELKEKRYESEEDAEKYQAAVNDITSKFPSLIQGFNDAGEVILNASEMERVLADARSKTAQATYEAAVAEQKKTEDELKAKQKSLKNDADMFENAFEFANNLVTGTAGQGNLIYSALGYDPSSSSPENAPALFKNLAKTFNGFVGDYTSMDVTGSDNSLSVYLGSVMEAIQESVKKNGESALGEWGFNNTEDYQRFISYTSAGGGIFDFANWDATLDTASPFLQNLNQIAQLYQAGEFNFENYAAKINQIKTAYDKLQGTLTSETLDEGAVQDAFNAYREALNSIEPYSPLYQLLGDARTYADSLGTSISEYGTLIAKDKAMSKQVASAWVSQQLGNKSIDGNLVSIIGNKLASIYNTDIINTTWQDAINNNAQDLRSTADTLIEQAQKFQANLDSDSNKKELFTKMTGNMGDYHWSDFEQAFGSTEGWNEISELIQEDYINQASSIRELVQGKIKNAIDKRHEKKIFSGTAAKLTRLSLDSNDFTIDEQTVLSSILDGYNKLLDKDYFQEAESYITSMLPIFSQIQNITDTDTRNSAFKALKDNNLATREGVFAAAADLDQIEGINDSIIEDLTAIGNDMFTNIPLAIQSLTDLANTTWKDQLKDFDKAINGGIEGYELTDFLSQANGLDGINISEKDFTILESGRLQLDYDKWLTYYQSIQSTVRAQIDSLSTLLENAAQITSKDQLTRPILDQMGISVKEGEDIQTEENWQKYTEALAEAQSQYLLLQQIPAMMEASLTNSQLKSGKFDAIKKSLSVEENGKAWDRLLALAEGATLTSPELADKQVNTTVKGIQGSLSSLISDILQKGTDNIDLAEYDYLAQDNIDLTGGLQAVVTRYVKAAGLTIEEANNQIFAAIEKQNSTTDVDLIKDLTFKTGNLVELTEEQFKNLVNTFKIDITTENGAQLVKTFQASLNTLTGKAAMSLELLSDAGLDLQSVDNFATVVNKSMATVFDNIGDSLTKGVELATKGTNKLADAQAFVESYNEVMNTSKTLEDLFSYNTALDAFALNNADLHLYLQQQAQQLGYTGTAIQEYIKNQTDSIIQNNIELDKLLKAETKQERSDEANKLIQQIRGLSNYKTIQYQSYAALNGFIDSEEAARKYAAMANEELDLMILHVLESGGQAAVDLLKQIKPDASSDELEAAFNSQINKLTDVLGQVGDLVAGEFVGTEGKLYEVLARAGAVDDNGVVKAGFDMVEIYAAIYAEMSRTAGATTAGLNDAYAQLLAAQDQTNIDITEALKNGNGMSYADFGNLLAKYDISFEEYMTEHFDTVMRDGFGNIRITDWEGFAKNIFKTDNLDAIKNTDEYVSAFKAYNDGLIELNKNAEQAIVDEIKQIENAKTGDWLNFSELWTKLESAWETIDFKTAVPNYNGNVSNMGHRVIVPGKIMDQYFGGHNGWGTIFGEDVAFKEFGETYANIGATFANLTEEGKKAPDIAAYAKELYTMAISRVGGDASKVTADLIKQIDAEEENLILNIKDFGDSVKPEEVLNALWEESDLYHKAEEQAYSATEVINASLQMYGASLEDGILKIGENANLLGVAQVLQEASEMAGLEIGNGLEEVKDTVLNILKSYSDAILKGIDGGLSNTEAADLRQKASDIGIKDLQFTQTKEGLKLSNESAKELYNTLKQIDALQGELVFSKLMDSLIATEDHFKTIQDTQAYIIKLRSQIEKPNNAERLKSLQDELDLAEKINMTRSIETEDDSFKFMEGKIPDAQNNPLNYWKNWAKAFEAMKKAGKGSGAAKNTMGYEDFYNIVSELGRLADITGHGVKLGEETLDNSQKAADLITRAAGALKNVNGELVVDLSGINVDFTSGLANLGDQIDGEVDALADSQIHMLDAIIAVLEIIVAMEKLKDLDIDNDLTLDFEELGIKVNDDGSIKSANDNLKETVNDLLSLEATLEDGTSVLDAVSIQSDKFNITMRDFLEHYKDVNWLNEKGITGNMYKTLFSNMLKLVSSPDWLDAAKNGSNFFEMMNRYDWGDLVIGVNTPDVTLRIGGTGNLSIDWSNVDSDAYERAFKEEFNEQVKTDLQKALDTESSSETGLKVDTNTKLKILNHTVVEVTDEKGNKTGEYTIAGHPGKKYSDKTLAAAVAELYEQGATEIDDTQWVDERKVKGKIKIGSAEFELESDGGDAKYTFQGRTGKNATETFNKFISEVEKNDTSGLFDDDGVINQESARYKELQVQYGLSLTPIITYTTSDGKTKEGNINKDTVLRDAVKDYLDTGEKEKIEIGDKATTVTFKGGIKATIPNDQLEFEIDKDKNKKVTEDSLKSYFSDLTGIDLGLKDTISSAIKDALSGITEQLNSLEPGKLSEVASALAEIAASLADIASKDIEKQIKQIKELQSAAENQNTKIDIPENKKDRVIANAEDIDGSEVENALTNIVHGAAEAVAKDNTFKETTGKTGESGGQTLVDNFGKELSNMAEQVMPQLTIAAAALGTKTAIMGEAGKQLGEAIVKGIQEGMTGNVQTISSAINAIASSIKTSLIPVLTQIKDLSKQEFNFDLGPDTENTAEVVATILEILGGITELRTQTIRIQAPGVDGVKNKLEALLSVLDAIAEKASIMINAEVGTASETPEEPPKEDTTTIRYEEKGEKPEPPESTAVDYIINIIQNGEITHIFDEMADYIIDIIQNGSIPSLHDQHATYTIDYVVRGGAVNRIGATIPLPKATGNVGLAKARGTQTLMGELGPELVVSNGRYFVAGQNGAEMVNLDDDAIVFNHLQTEQLLKNGMSKSRGRAVTNERNAVAFATGNVEGPAMASASAALNALKQLRAMWESLKSASISDLAGAGGSGGGGGGGGGDNAKIVDPSIWVDTVERWYNLMQKIAKLEKEITHEEKLRSKLSSDWTANGNHYYASQKRSLEALRDQIDAQEQLNLSREAYYDQRVDALKNQPFGQLIEFDNEGQMRFKEGAMDWLTNLVGFDQNGKANYTDEEKYNILMAAGYGDYMKYDSSGGEIKMDDDNDGEVTDDERQSFYGEATQAFWDKINDYKDATQSLWDSIKEGEDSILQLQADQNELLEEIRENQMAVEDAVLDAIEDMRQREIDALQDERDKLEESTQKYIDGLSDALDREKEMYQNQEDESSLNQQKRRLAILQRSGGSAEDIANLRSEIDSSERERYFNLQQQQIDAIQRASDLEIERMDSQIELMTETLEYQKEYGLLWGNVYEVMEGTAEQITSFITNGNSEFWASSELATQKVINEQLFAAEQWTSYRDDLIAAKAGIDANTSGINANGATAKDIRDNVALMVTMTRRQLADTDYTIFDEAMKAEFGEDYDPNSAYKQLFYDDYMGHGDVTRATATARAQYAADKKAAEDAAAAQAAAEAAAAAEEPHGGEPEEDKGCPDCAVNCGGACYNACENGCSRVCKGSSHKNDPEIGNCNGNCQGTAKGHTGTNTAAGNAYTRRATGKAAGGYVNHGIYELGERGTETVLTASQTKILRDNILSNRPNSLISLLKSYNEGYDGINNSVSGVTPVEDNSTIIEKVELNMEVKQIANDYDARRAGEQALNEMMRIARKTGAANSIRR